MGSSSRSLFCIFSRRMKMKETGRIKRKRRDKGTGEDRSTLERGEK